jgi:hypothetical protein
LELTVGVWIFEFVRGKLDKRQYGAIIEHSTTHALVDILHHWHQALDTSESVRATFIDYAMAFDHVDHSIFVGKLYNSSVPVFESVGYVPFSLIACSVLTYQNTSQNG